MRLEIPKANLPLYTVSEETLESQAAGVFWSSLFEGLGEGADSGTDPPPLQRKPLCPLSGNSRGSWASHCLFFPPPMRVPSMVVLSSETWISESGDLGSRP